MLSVELYDPYCWIVEVKVWFNQLVTHNYFHLSGWVKKTAIVYKFFTGLYKIYWRNASVRQERVISFARSSCAPPPAGPNRTKTFFLFGAHIRLFNFSNNILTIYTLNLPQFCLGKGGWETYRELGFFALLAMLAPARYYLTFTTCFLGTLLLKGLFGEWSRTQRSGL